jgi:hypothetical protein
LVSASEFSPLKQRSSKPNLKIMGAPQWAKRQGNGGKRHEGGGGAGNGGAIAGGKKDQPQQERRSRPSKTNRAQEAKRFSTITMPRRAEVKTANERGLAPDMRARPPAQYVAQMQEKQRTANAAAVAAVAARQSQQSQTGKTSLPFDPSPAAATRGFDPIPNDGMFDIVPPEASHWPPPSLTEIFGSEDAARAAENLDQYDRTAEDSAAAAAAEQVAKKVAAKRVAGELRHPRGKAPVNAKVKLGGDSDSD